MIDGISQCSKNTLFLLYEESYYFRSVLSERETLDLLSKKKGVEKVGSFQSLLSLLPTENDKENSRDVDSLMILHATNGNLDSFIRCVKNGGSKWKKSAYYAELNYHNNILDWMFSFVNRKNLRELLAIYKSRTLTTEDDVEEITVEVPTKDVILSGMLLGAVSKQDLDRVKYLTKSKISNVSEAVQVASTLNMEEITVHLLTIN